MPLQKIPALQSLLKQVASKGRRLQSGMNSTACHEECPGTVELLTAMSKAVDVDTSDMSQSINLLCPHEEAISCIIEHAERGGSRVCQICDSAYRICQGVDVDSLGAITCLCACPDMAVVSSDEASPERCAVVNCQMASAKCEVFHFSTAMQTNKKTCDASPAARHVAPVVLVLLSVAAHFA